MPSRTPFHAETVAPAGCRAHAVLARHPPAAACKALTRGLTLLEKLAETEGGITLTEISSRVSLPPSTAHRLLNTLADMGFVLSGQGVRPLVCRPQDLSRWLRVLFPPRFRGRAIPICAS